MPSNSVGSVSARFTVWRSARSRSANSRGGRGEHVEAAAIELGEPGAPRDEVQRRALLRRCLGEDQRAVRKVERREPDLARQLLAARLPAQPPRDHQVDHDEAIAVDADHDPLAEPLDRLDDRAGELLRRRRHRAQHERARDPDPLERLADDQRAQALDVDRDVGELGHRASIVQLATARARPLQSPSSRRAAS